MNVMSVEKRNDILRLLCEGNSIRSICRLMGTSIASVLRQLEWASEHCQAVMDERFVNMTFRHVEIDEMWTFVGKKQSRLTVEEKASCFDRGDIYLWYGIDQDTKLVPAFLCGKRTADNARRFLRSLASRIVFPQPDPTTGQYRPGDYAPIIQISTDAWTAYPEAVDQFFGIHARYGTIRKEFKNARMRYDPSEIVGTKRRAIFNLTGRQRTICTSHIERCNLTVRTFMKRFTRLALGFSKKLECLEWAVTLHMCYYNFCWQTRMPGKSGKKRPTAAMMAGLTDHVWTFAELMSK